LRWVYPRHDWREPALGPGERALVAYQETTSDAVSGTRYAAVESST